MTSTLNVDDVIQDYERRITDVVREKIALHDKQGLDKSIVIGSMDWVKLRWKIWQMELPDIDPHYAVKCNEDLNVLSTLACLSSGFDCASEHEIKRVLDLGVDPSRIIYANTIKTDSMLRFAAQNSVSLMTFDNEDELYKIKSIYPVAQLILRIKVEGDKNTFYQLNEKFGCHPTRARKLLEIARDLNLTVIGTSFHVGSLATDVTVFTRAIRDARQVHDIGLQLGFDMQVLDIGGGFPGDSKSLALFKEMTKDIRDGLHTHFSDLPNVRIIAEPGRFMVETSFTLCMKVIGRSTDEESAVKTRKNENCGNHKHGDPNHDEKDVDVCIGDATCHLATKKFMYYLNQGIYGYLSHIFKESAADLEFLTLQDYSDRPRYRSTLWGPTCDSTDFIKDDVCLPELHLGDWLYLRDAGAYWAATETNFMGMPSPDVHYVDLLK